MTLLKSLICQFVAGMLIVSGRLLEHTTSCQFDPLKRVVLLGVVKFEMSHVL
jgi:hypothetical protein